jgi:hypothetical protein
MKLAPSDLDQSSLARIGAEGAALISSGKLQALHTTFGYALAFDRAPLKALEDDIAAALAEVGASGFDNSNQSSVKVSYFKQNDSGIDGLVACHIPASNGRHILAEFVFTRSTSEANLMLEQVSGAT